MRYSLVDVEATGLHDDSYPIEIAVLHKGNLYEWLIAPLDGWIHWDKVAEMECHGLSRETKITKGINASFVANTLNRLLCSTTAYSEAAVWDEEWINRLFSDNGIIQAFPVHPIQDLMLQNRATRFNHMKHTLSQDDAIAHLVGKDVM